MTENGDSGRSGGGADDYQASDAIGVTVLQSRPTRWIIGLAGVVSFALGLVAVFETDNGAGSAALLTIGAGFVLIGVLGPQLRSLKISGVEADLAVRARVAEELREVSVERFEEGDEETAEELMARSQQLMWNLANVARHMDLGEARPEWYSQADRLRLGRDIARSSLSRVPSSSSSFESGVLVVFDSLQPLPTVLVDFGNPQERWDVVLRYTDGSIGVDLRRGPSIRADAVSSFLEKVEQSEVVDAGLMIINVSSTLSPRWSVAGSESSFDQPPAELVHWQDGDDPAPIVEAINRLRALIGFQ